MAVKAERGETTRQQIIAQATKLFAVTGYEAASIDAVLRACGISRGALYHHFSSKMALFTAVLEAEEARIAATLMEAAQGHTKPLDMLRAGCAAWLRMAASDSAVRRIVLTDAPSVVGWDVWRDIDSRHGLGLLKAAFGTAASLGHLPKNRVDTYAHALLAVLTEMALLVARAGDREAAAVAGQDAVELVLTRFMGLAAASSGSQVDTLQ
jgi:AcrR family transcriptional regulator